MTIDELVANRVREILATDGYCTRREATELAKKVVDEMQEGFDKNIAELANEQERLLAMNDRLWDQLQKLSEPKFPKLRQFFHFKWLKFWRNWNINWPWSKS